MDWSILKFGNKPALALKIINYVFNKSFILPEGVVTSFFNRSRNNFSMHSTSLQSPGISADFLKELEFWIVRMTKININLKNIILEQCFIVNLSKWHDIWYFLWYVGINYMSFTFYNRLGALHEWCHLFFENFNPPSPKVTFQWPPYSNAPK